MKKMFWIDLEMTGLDEKVDKILEVAVIVTDLNLQTLETYHQVVYQPKEVLDAMNDWCKSTHGKSGLTEKVATGSPLYEVEKGLIALAQKFYKEKDEKVVLCGNSVSMDKKFIDEYMKDFSKLLHYRVVDVSSFKEIYRSKYNIEVKKSDRHRALEDIQESIAELQHYLSYIQVSH